MEAIPLELHYLILMLKLELNALQESVNVTSQLHINESFGPCHLPFLPGCL